MLTGRCYAHPPVSISPVRRSRGARLTPHRREGEYMAGEVKKSQRAKAVTAAGKGILTPLSIIALFLTFSETVLGIAVTQTSGSIQVALTCFVTSFPVLVAAAFFAIL